MRDKLRRRYQVHKEVARAGRFDGGIDLSQLNRLAELTYAETAGDGDRRVCVEFEFLSNEYDLPMIRGRLETSLRLQCQRCLRGMDWPVDQRFELVIDAGEEWQRQGGYDTLDSDDGVIDVFDLVEDEIMLALPLVAMHEDDTCNDYWPATAAETDVAAKENPFAVLAHLKTAESD